MQRLATHLSPGGPTSVKSPKQTTVITRHVSSVGQKPILDSKAGNTRNIGSVGSTYQNVSPSVVRDLGGWLVLDMPDQGQDRYHWKRAFHDDNSRTIWP